DEHLHGRAAAARALGEQVAGTELRARTNGQRDVPSSSRRLGYVLALVDDRHDPVRSEREEVVIHFAKHGFRQTIFEMYAAMRMNEIVLIVVPEERSEAEPLDVKIRLRKEAGAAGA